MSETKLAPNRLLSLMKAYPVTLLKTGNIRTCPVRLSFPHLFVPQPDDNGTMKYSASLLFPKMADLTLLKKAAFELACSEFSEAEAKSGALHWPFRDQGVKTFAGYEAGSLFTSVNTKQRPGVVGPDGRPIVDQEEIYPGCWALVTVRPFAFGTEKGSKKKGVSFGLQNVQKIADDESFAGGARADEEFEALDASLAGEDAFAGAGAGGGNAYDFV